MIDNKLCLFANASATADNSTADDGIVVVNSTGSTAGLLTTLGITANVANYAPTLQQSANFTVPRWRTTDDQPRPTGSVWNKITSSNLGTSMVVKKYSTALGAFVQQSAAVYANDQSANATLDPTGGGKNIAVGTTYTQYNVNPELSGVAAYPYNNTYTLQVFERVAQGATVITGSTSTPTFTNGNQFTIQTSVANSTSLTTAVTATISGTTAAAFITAVSSAGVPGVSAAVDSTGAIVFTQSIGGVIVLDNVGAGTALSNAGFTTATTGCRSAVVVSDYCKGFLTEPDIEFICNQHKTVFLDTKKILGWYANNVKFIKINHNEYLNNENILNENHILLNKTIITKGKYGCEYQGKIFPTEEVPVKDISGAGDTFLAGLVVEFLKTKNIIQAIDFAQECTTLVVQKSGVSTI